MAEKITDEQVEALQNILRADVSVDAKVAQVTAVKTGIKHHNVPDTCVAPLFEALRTASSTQNGVLVNAGLTSLNHLLTRLSRQEPKYIVKETKTTLPLLVDRMGDQKEKFRTLAVQSLATMYKVVPADVERHVRNFAMAGKNPKAKEASMQWLLQMHREQGLQFRTYVPRLMELLEDADPSVRDTAKTTVIELFRDASGTAKADLKKQLENFRVRPAIKQAIVKELIPRSTTPAPDENGPAELPRPVSRPNLSASVSSVSTFSERPITPMPDARTETVEPSYLNTTRELDDMFTQMHTYFDGKESEHNWMLREQSINKLRRLMAGNAVSDYHDPFLAGMRSILDGIIKAITSLRTSLSKEGCALVQDIAINYGPGMDPMVELLMQTFVKLSAATKKIASQQANVCIDTIIGRVTYTNRIMQHVAMACTDKNVQPRLYATEWLKTLLKKEAHHKSHVEHNGGLDLIEKSIKKGLNDANPGVREKMRATFWTFHGIWPARAEALMNTLEPTAQKLLEKDPNNPNTPKKAEPAARPGLGLSRSTMGAKPSLRETMMAQKKAMATKNLPLLDCYGKCHRSIHHHNTSKAHHQRRAISSPRQADEEATRNGTAASDCRTIFCARWHRHRDEPPTSETEGSDAKNHGRITQADDTKNEAGTQANYDPTKSPSRPRLQPGPLLGSPQPEDSLSLIAPTTPILPAADSPDIASAELVAPETPVAVDRDQAASPAGTPSKALRVYEDPLTAEQSTPRLTPPAVLEEKPVNEDAANLVARQNGDGAVQADISPEKAKQHARLIESALAKIKAKSLDVHGFRKLQGILRDNKSPLSDEKFEALLLGLFDYLEDPQSNLTPEKIQDVKAQNLATIKLLLKKYRGHFQPHISKGLESLMSARAVYDARTHIVSGLELLADELVALGDAQEIATVLTRRMTDTVVDDAAGWRSLSMGLHVLKEMVDAKAEYMPTDQELASMAALCTRCLDSTESGVRMDAVQLCVALQGRVGDARFWDVMKDVKDDPKSLITYYIVKRQREKEASNSVA
ncbi:STU1-like protein [Diaporthe amygdali]|uniref:STU1-like protein n=1 Tax=Phomopsis amygdali TaxID=1214568 RepID=UPI0022FF0D78|nr:STU1-like protein [Diaporthe amygdali]KAJ0117887.1 STU1-like protein [Diaporthe amygdali]